MPKPANQTETAWTEATCSAHISRMLGRISDKWSLLVVWSLGRGPCRFNALRREVGEISQKVLASTLRDLEANGFVSRTVTPVTPPQVEYALTELGIEFLQPVRMLAEWVMSNSERMEAAALEFEQRRKPKSRPIRVSLPRY
ncbi:winged helix-turn-helix transcriptional regulator [Oryzifoliimicrobium ureilyticus]|uniref:winged helix-turn-helix transcriptional regulator n=1 Tax=Oryzifoliimicrobium ureilyticus TaxID=3113724 RepID=UPI003F666B42